MWIPLSPASLWGGSRGREVLNVYRLWHWLCKSYVPMTMVRFLWLCTTLFNNVYIGDANCFDSFIHSFLIHNCLSGSSLPFSWVVFLKGRTQIELRINNRALSEMKNCLLIQCEDWCPAMLLPLPPSPFFWIEWPIKNMTILSWRPPSCAPVATCWAGEERFRRFQASAFLWFACFLTF